MKKLIAAVTLVVVGSLAVAAQAANLTGKWVLNVQTDAGSGTPTVTLKQEGDKLSGHYSGQLGEADLTGTVKGNEFTFSFSGDAQGQQFKVVYTGTVEKDTMKGTLDLAGMASGTFTGKKQ